MSTFTVHVPPEIAEETARADRTVFVREGFTWAAFLLGPLFLLYRGLWRASLAWLAAAAALFALAVACDLGALPRLLLYLVLAVLTGLEASEARRRALTRAGFIPAALLCGVTRETGERQFFSGPPPLSEPLPSRRDAATAAMLRPTGVIGSFPTARHLPGRGRP